MIEKNSKLLLFRYSNYKKYDFIKEHVFIINNKGYVWMMKIGKKISSKKIKNIIETGGYLILKSPILDGNKYYIGKIEDFTEKEVDKNFEPNYYSEIIEEEIFWDCEKQYFKITKLIPLDEKYVDNLLLEINKKKIKDVINETRTAVMYIENDVDFNIDL